MGIHSNIDFNKFPKQGRWINKKVMVCFNYDADNQIAGQIVRDDEEEPFKLIIKLEDGRYVLSTECQYRLVD